MNKKIIVYLLIPAFIISCQNKNTDAENNIKDSVIVKEVKENNLSNSSVNFDIKTLPISEKLFGAFPYLSYPDGYNFNYEKNISSKDIKDLDIEYFAINGVFQAQEGKTYKVRIEKEQNTGSRFNSLIVERYYDNKILELGGVKVNNTPVRKEELIRIGDDKLIKKNYGFSIDYNLLDDIKTYVINTKEKEVWIQFTLMNDEVGKLTILEKAKN